MPSYICPECNAKVRSEKEAKPGQVFECPSCEAEFTPRAETIKFADDDDDKPKKSKTKAPKAAAAPPPPPPPALDDDGDPMTYGVAQESEDEKRLAEKNKPTFGAVKDKFKKSARGPAAALLVTPANLMLAQGGLLAIFGLTATILGIWPLWFTDVPASDEEFAECTFWIFFGICSMVWGGITCFGAVQMVGLGSYAWAVVGAVFALFPLLAGIFALVTLRDERVLAGFAEPETGPIQSDADDKKDEEEEDEDDDEDEEDDEDEDDEE
jgi:DNA-directed RNA polymerase subunit M/transcription elongation factor TFIIS